MIIGAAASILFKVEVDAAWAIDKALPPVGAGCLTRIALAKCRIAQVSEEMRRGADSLPAYSRRNDLRLAQLMLHQQQA